jgi:pyridoxamine 5'-phosphate oxidase
MEHNSPIDLFTDWFLEAKKSKTKEPEALNLATASKDGKPSNRMVLLKDYSEKGFVFYTNLESRKGLELGENPFAAMCFYWEKINKQVRIEGAVSSVSNEEADKYFASRPLQSRIGAYLSKQSRNIDGNVDLLKEVAKQSIELANKRLKRPNFWSGFCVEPYKIEFWERGDFRLHKRILYSLNDKKTWSKSFLYP